MRTPVPIAAALLAVLALVVLALAAPSLAAPAAARPHPGAAKDIVVSQAVVRASLGGSPNSAAYMTIDNRGGRPDRLVSVDCACADQAQVHLSRMAGGMMTMEPAGPVVVPAHGRVSLAPGGLHVMLMGLKGPLVDGRRQTMVLTFERAGPMRVGFQVRARILGGETGARPGAGR
jgi:periplasmic copper chaperone A